MAINGNGRQGLLSAVAALVVLLGGMYAMTRPQEIRIAQMEARLIEMRALAERNQSDVGRHVLNVTRNETKVTEVAARVKEIETWRDWWTKDMMRAQVKLEEKVKTLERQAYGGATPQISGE